MLKAKRKEKHLTVRQFAEILGISKSYVTKLEKHPERCNPTINLILKLSIVLGLCPYFVFKFFIENRKYQE